MLSAVVEAERAEEATKESRLLERRATLKERWSRRCRDKGTAGPGGRWCQQPDPGLCRPDLDLAERTADATWEERAARCRSSLCVHCREHAQERQGRTTSAKPEGRRDKGICITCGAPAELNPAVRGTHRELCVRAELAQITVARLCTQRLCYDCKPQSSSRAGVGTAPRRG